MKLKVLSLLLLASATLQAQQPPPQPTPNTPTHDDTLRGPYGPFRANNDLLYYHLDIRVDPVQKTLRGHNLIRFRMLHEGSRIQLELIPTLGIDGITLGHTDLKYTRDSGTVYVDFPQPLQAGHTYTIDFRYSGSPQETGRFGCFTFKQDPSGHPWINTACEETGASVWWPNKDQWRDEPQDGMDISVAVPNALTNVSNGRFVRKVDLHDGYTRWDYRVHYPINNYDVSLNIGNYAHFSGKHKDLTLDFYALPEDLDKAKKQFAQANGMLDAFEHYFGEYPFKKDGYKLIQVPYAGMEHQSAVTYGNHFANGYLDRDWTGVGISTRFDFIIIHESGHEWFGNAVTAADRSDMWIHEGWTTYLELLYVEYHYGHADATKYANGLKPKVRNRAPIIPARNLNISPPQDMYFKGALFLNTLRSVLDSTENDDDKKWFALIHDFYQHFKYQTIMTEDVIAYFNQQTGQDFTPLFNEYLRHAALPTLDLTFNPEQGTVTYQWIADEPAFAMPIRVGTPGRWQLIHPTTQAQTMKTDLAADTFTADTDNFYVNLNKH